MLRARAWTRRVLIISTLLLALLSLLARLGRLHWSFDLLSHFHDAYFIVAGVAMVFFIFLKNPLWSLVAGGVAVVNAALLVPYLPLAFIQAAPSAGPSLKLYSHNVYYRNSDPLAIAEDITSFDPDIVFLMEYSDAVRAELEPTFSDYPYRLIEPSRRTMGLALFSRIPLDNAQVFRTEATRIPTLRVDFSWEGQRVSFVGAHPWPPVGRWGQLHRDQLFGVADVVGEVTTPLIVAGDFNASPWSYGLTRLKQAGDLRDARRGFGLRKTWHYTLLRLNLDHLLVSNEWQVLNVQQGDWGGSDHAPLQLELQLAETARE